MYIFPCKVTLRCCVLFIYRKKVVPILWVITKHIRQCPQECWFNLYEYKYNIKSSEITTTTQEDNKFVRMRESDTKHLCLLHGTDIYVMWDCEKVQHCGK